MSEPLGIITLTENEWRLLLFWHAQYSFSLGKWFSLPPHLMREPEPEADEPLIVEAKAEVIP